MVSIIKVKMELKEVEKQRDSSSSSLQEALSRVDKTDGNIVHMTCWLCYTVYLLLGEYKKLREHSSFLELELGNVKEASQKLEAELTVLKDQLQQKDAEYYNQLKKRNLMGMNQAQVGFSRAENIIKKNEEEILHQKLLEMELHHMEQVNNNMKITNEVTVSLIIYDIFNKLVVYFLKLKLMEVEKECEQTKRTLSLYKNK